jgi:TPR repeat protein
LYRNRIGRLIALLDPIIKEKQYLSLLDWLAGQGDLESLRSIMARCRPVVSWYRRGDDPTNFYQETNSSSDEKSAYFWYSQIMENRKHPLYTEAQYWLGMLYLNPIKKFILPNDAKGIQLVQEAAKAGEPRACLEIGKRYISGSLVEQDIDEGIQWLEKAARLGEPSGLYYLYEAYSIGEVIPQDQEKAEAYLDKALAKNDPSAIREKEIRLHQRERQRKLAKAPLPQLGDSLMAPAGFPGWPSEQAPMGESHPAAEVPYSATLQPGHFHSIPDLQAKETSSMLTDFQAEANNLDAPTLEDFSTLDELFGDISLPEDIINSLLLPQEDRDEGSGN